MSIKLISGCILLVCFAIGSSAQTTAKMAEEGGKRAAKLEKSQVPKEVVNAFANEFPVLVSVDWYGYPAIDNQSDWYVSDPYRSSNLTPQSYVVEFVKENVPYKAIYDKSGKKIGVHKMLTSDLRQTMLTAITNGKYVSLRSTTYCLVDSFY